MSLSLRRAWIEICCINIIDDSFRSLSLRRAWIEIARTWEPTRRPDGRSPYGERGLKSRLALHRPTARLSLSLRRAWIEIARANASDGPSRSLSLRRAWIEITIRPFVIGWPCRSPYGERGLKFGAPAEPERDDASLSLRRAWIEICCINIIDDSFRSLSLRRAWIEIARTWEPTRRPDGRSPYGERGLKSRLALHRPTARLSLSLRRAWIEIARANASDGPSRSLSLRRAWIEITIRPFVIGWPCRSPYGERGLKFGAPAEPERDDASLSLRRAWIEIPGRCRFSRSTSVALLTESVD